MSTLYDNFMQLYNAHNYSPHMEFGIVTSLTSKHITIKLVFSITFDAHELYNGNGDRMEHTSICDVHAKMEA